MNVPQIIHTSEIWVSAHLDLALYENSISILYCIAKRNLIIYLWFIDTCLNWLYSFHIFRVIVMVWHSLASFEYKAENKILLCRTMVMLIKCLQTFFHILSNFPMFNQAILCCQFPWKKTPVTRYNTVLSVTVSIVSMSCDVVSSNHSCATCVSEKPTGNSLKIDQINWNLFGLAKMESHQLDCPSDDDDVVIA